MVARGVAESAGGRSLYLALLNAGVLGGDSELADFVARNLTDADVRILLTIYDRAEPFRQRVPKEFTWRENLPRMTVYEASYRLERLSAFGFFSRDPVEATRPVEHRVFRVDADQLYAIDTVAEQAGLVRNVAVAPSSAYPAVASALKAGTLAELVATSGELVRGGRMLMDGGVVRRHVIDGYQWAIVRYGHGWQEFTGTFPTPDEAQNAADQQLGRLGISAEWVAVAA